MCALVFPFSFVGFGLKFPLVQKSSEIHFLLYDVNITIGVLNFDLRFYLTNILSLTLRQLFYTSDGGTIALDWLMKCDGKYETFNFKLVTLIV